MFDWLVGWVAPHDCLVCGEEGSLLCAYCLPDAVEVLPERCYHCKAVSAEGAVCLKCRRKSPLKYVWVRAQYTDTAKLLVYRLKFGRTRAAAKSIAQLLDDSVPALGRDVVVTHVPTATSRVRQRGYDQTKLIAQYFAKARGVRYEPLLFRLGQSRQVGSDRKHRQQQALQSYIPRRQDLSAYTEVLLVDDIVTTGATIEAAAKILKKTGVWRVNAAIFAQKQ